MQRAYPDDELVHIGRSDPGDRPYVPFNLEDGGPSDKFPQMSSLVHAAAYVPKDQAQPDLLRPERVNGGGIIHLMDRTEMEELQSIVHVSSGHLWHPAQFRSARNPYEASKHSAELLLEAYATKYGFEVLHLRLGYVYGPGMVHGRMFRIFIERALNGDSLVVYNGGQDQHHVVHVSDVATAVVAGLGTVGLSGVYDICAAEPVSTMQVAETVRSVVDPTIEIRVEEGDSSPVEPMDPAPAREDLGFSATTSLREGIETMLREDYGVPE